jgi:Tfp pilus assembly protein PilP
MQAALVLIVLALAAGCSADCDSDVQEYIEGLASLKIWALQSLHIIIFNLTQI